LLGDLRMAERGTVVQFGAGNIGRGFMGQVYTEAGYEVVFIDVAETIVDALNQRRSYPLRLVGPDRFEELTIAPVRAVNGRDIDAVATEIADCEFVCTAVGVNALPHLVPALAEGVRRREGSLNVILCENQLHCSTLLRTMLEPHLTPEQLARVGLVESSVGRMVPVMSEADRASDPLLVAAEDYSRLPVDLSGFLGAPPPVPALKPVDHFEAYVERKLFIHNCGHAVTGYLGYLHGCEYIYEALEIPEVAECADRAMCESGEALRRKYSLDVDDLRQEREGLLRRFRNAHLRDTVFRVCRDPIRKLRPDDRLIGAALNCLDQGVEPEHIVRGISAALRFDHRDDPSAQAVQSTIRDYGLGEALVRFTGQNPNGELGRRIVGALDN
jgi:mannitol-1-phosphate 5-dehydrogenase